MAKQNPCVSLKATKNSSAYDCFQKGEQMQHEKGKPLRLGREKGDFFFSWIDGLVIFRRIRISHLERISVLRIEISRGEQAYV
jgi:hypothetical protein